MSTLEILPSPNLGLTMLDAPVMKLTFDVAQGPAGTPGTVGTNGIDGTDGFLGGTLETFATYADLVLARATLTDRQLVIVLANENLGGRTCWIRVIKSQLLLDFTNDYYYVYDGTLEFEVLHIAAFHMVSPFPVSSSTFGVLGDFSIDGTSLAWHNGTQWYKTTGVTF